MLTRLLATIVLIGSAAIAVQSQPNEYCQFLPQNDMKIPVDQMSSAMGGITEQEFNAVLDRIQAMYAPEIKALGGELNINRLWEDETVNASADRSGGKWNLNMYGGLARHQAVTMDGFAVVACHEMGHHLGGAPKYGGFANKWASNEGEADYYANLKCMRRYFEKDNNLKIVANMDIDATVVSQCQATFTEKVEQAICERSAMAGLSVATLLNELGGGSKELAFNTPDPAQVRKTFNAHPAAQCRLDTYLAAADCGVPVSQALSDTDFKVGSCADPAQFQRGFRPRCWFQPEPTWWEKLKERWKKRHPGETMPMPQPEPQTPDDDSNGPINGVFY
jgi:hypothetical protein